MVKGVIIDFAITFVICFVIYICIRKKQRPDAKSTIIAIGLGVLALGLTLGIGFLLDYIIILYIDVYIEVLNFKIPIIYPLYLLVREILLFVVIEEVTKYFLFDWLWNNGKIKLTSPLQTVLLFVIIGSVFSFGEDVRYILDGTLPYARILTIISGHLVYGLIYGRHYSKEVVRMKASYMMEDYLEVLKNNQYWNPYLGRSRHQLNGLKVAFAVHFVHNVFCKLPLGWLVWIEVAIMTIYFFKKIKKMNDKDLPYEILAERNIHNYFPDLAEDLKKAKMSQ